MLMRNHGAILFSIGELWELLRKGDAAFGEDHPKFGSGRNCGAGGEKPAHEADRGQHGGCKQQGEYGADPCGRLFHLCGNFVVKTFIKEMR